MTPAGPVEEPVAQVLGLMRERASGVVSGPPCAELPAATWALLEENRLGRLCTDDRSARIDDYREAVWGMNASALITILQVSKVLTREEIPHVFIKGPLLTQSLYADYFFRLSTDVDVLVAPGDRRRSLRALHDLGYRSSRENETLYWRLFLGEQHLETLRPDLSTLDLHVAIRHPAGHPRALTRELLARRTGRPLGDGVVSVPHPMDEVLLAALYLLKALLKREPAGAHLLDCAVLQGRCEMRERRTIAALAAERGLSRAAAFAAESVRALREPDAGGPSAGAGPLSQVLGGQDFWQRLLAPSRAKPFGRVRAVAVSCDRAADRGHALAWEIGRKLAQKAAHAGLF